MSFAQALPIPQRFSSRWLVFISLALNLFFVGLIASLWVRGPAPLDRSAPARIERLAAALPAADGEKLRTLYAARSAEILSQQTRYEKARNDIRAELRREPADGAALKQAMARTREARLAFDELLQNVIAQAAVEISPEGRQRLANYSPPTRQPR